ncbi:MAG: CBS domain-containing protein [Xanthobacteraceae bacterium]
MKAAEIMVTNVITVTPNHSVHEVAEILLERRISGVPVLNAAGELVGIVSEGDLMRRADAGTGHRRSWWLRLLMGREGLAQEFVKEHARKVADIMTHDVITASPETPVSDLAELLERNAIKRVPIVDGRKVVGIVSRANLLQALAALRKQISVERPVGDAALRDLVLARFNAEPWMRTSLINVTAHDGTVDLWGVVDTETEKKAIRVAAEVTPGVRSVNDSIIVRPVVTSA